MTSPLLVILGATAVGKTKLAVSLAERFNGEIISADSRQVFKGMDIGTGKDLSEYHLNGKFIPHHLIDIIEPGERYHVNAFKLDFYEAFSAISNREKLPILCGGTGMYIHSILQKHHLTAVPVNEALRMSLGSLSKPELQETLFSYKENRLKADLSSSKRLIRAIEIAEYLKFNELTEISAPKFELLVIGLQNDLAKRREKILERLSLRLKSGLIEEVQTLLAAGVSSEMLTFYGLEYKFVAAYLNGDFDFETLKLRLGVAICQFAKRQMTFFRKMEKDGVKISWLSADDSFELLKANAIHLIEHKFGLK